jgi:transposase
MNQKKQTAESKVKEIRRHTRKKYSAEEKIRIVIEGLRGEISIAELCRKEGINANLYYNWSKDFLEAVKHCPLYARITVRNGQESVSGLGKNMQGVSMPGIGGQDDRYGGSAFNGIYILWYHRKNEVTAVPP